MIEDIAALQCHCELCGHEWITGWSEEAPARCAKCKGRRWNFSGGSVGGLGRKGVLSKGRKPKQEEQVIKARSLGMTTAMREGLDVGKPQKPVAKMDPRDRNPLKIEPGFWVSPDGERTCGHGCKRCGKCGKSKGARDGVEHS